MGYILRFTAHRRDAVAASPLEFPVDVLDPTIAASCVHRAVVHSAEPQEGIRISSELKHYMVLDWERIKLNGLLYVRPRAHDTVRGILTRFKGKYQRDPYRRRSVEKLCENFDACLGSILLYRE